MRRAPWGFTEGEVKDFNQECIIRVSNVTASRFFTAMQIGSNLRTFIR